MAKGKARQGPTQRQLRVSEALRKALSDVFLRSETLHPWRGDAEG